MQNNTFPKTEKLCSYSDIQKLFSEGKSIKNLSLLVFTVAALAINLDFA